MSTRTIRILEELKKPSAASRSWLGGSIKTVVEALETTKATQIWILYSVRSIENLVQAMAHATPKVRGARVISYERPTLAAAQIIESGFARALLGVPEMVGLDDLEEVLANDHPEDFCIGGEWDGEMKTVALWRGDFSVLVVPLSAFPARGGVVPDPARLSIKDCGQTVRLGEYEAAFDALLYERDPIYRRRAKKKMIAEEQSVGASIRRLRLMRGLARSDLKGLDPRTLARIEHGEVSSPQTSTLEAIAKQLGVSVTELLEY